MSGTALYRALVHAGAPENEAKEASDIVDGKFNDIDRRLTRLEVTSRLNLGVSLVILLFILKLSFAP